jgi:hypothetical protein
MNLLASASALVGFAVSLVVGLHRNGNISLHPCPLVAVDGGAG